MNRTELFKLSISAICAGVAAGFMALRCPEPGLAQTHRAAAASAAKPPPKADTPARADSAAVVSGSKELPPDDGEDELNCLDYEESEVSGIFTFTKWRYRRKDMVVTGDTGMYDRKKDTLDSQDPVVMDDDKHHVTADKGHVDDAKDDPDRRTVTLTGHVVMVLKPEKPAAGPVAPMPVSAPPAAPPSGTAAQNASAPPAGQSSEGAANPSNPPDKDRDRGKKERARGGTITCDKVDYKTKTKYSILSGHVVFTQKFTDDDGKSVERIITCEHAENDGKANRLHLFKPVHFEDTQHRKFDSPDDVFIGTEEGKETVKGTHMTVSFPSEKDEDDSAPGGKTTDKNGARTAAGSNGKSGAK